VTSLGKLFTPMCLSHQASIIWYQPRVDDAVWLGNSKSYVTLAVHHRLK